MGRPKQNNLDVITSGYQCLCFKKKNNSHCFCEQLHKKGKPSMKAQRKAHIQKKDTLKTGDRKRFFFFLNLILLVQLLKFP